MLRQGPTTAGHANPSTTLPISRHLHWLTKCGSLKGSIDIAKSPTHMLTKYASSTEFLSAVADHLAAVPPEVKSAVLEGISAGDQALRLGAPEEETFSY